MSNVKKKRKSRSKGKPINAALFIAKLDEIRTRVRSVYGSKDAEIPATDACIKDLALLIRVAKAETMYRDVEDDAGIEQAEPAGRSAKRLSNKDRRNAENDALLAGLGKEPAFNPNKGPDVAALGRTPRIRREPTLIPATEETVADKELF